MKHTKTLSRSSRILLFLVGLCAARPGFAQSEPKLPTAWQEAWDRPAARHRPLQIVHGIHLTAATQANGAPSDRSEPLARAALETMRRYQELGLGGIVCNVAFQDYLVSPQNWDCLVAIVQACRDLGLIVWIYDEQGYPSGAAGGLVLQEHPEFEALELAYDASLAEPFIVRPAYEHTHASNNFYAARRYVNLIDDRAVRCFVEKTHEQYWQRLGPHFGDTIQAMFTDEPSLMAVNIGPLGEEVRRKVRVVDPLDPNVRPLPCVPWSYDLPQQYQQRFGEDLLARRGSLFAGSAPDDVRTRRQYWSLVADLVADRYFGTLQRWCDEHHVASSGHSLWEESVLHHVPLEGNALKVLGCMQIPGLDMLNSDPEAVIHSGWLTAGLPASAARLGNRRRVMTEVSDFVQKMGGKGPVTLAEMQATAAWQATWDVTDFTLYYAPSDRADDKYRAYCDFVGRLNAVLLDAVPVAEVLLYYPVYELWGEYVPVAEPLQLSSQSPRARQLVESCQRLGQILQRNQIPFTLIDHEQLSRAEVQNDGSLKIGQQQYRSLVVPAGAKLPDGAAASVARFVSLGGRVVDERVDGKPIPQETLIGMLRSPVTIQPASPHIALGRFVRDQRQILVVVNVGTQPYEGQLSVSSNCRWLSLDPTTGSVQGAVQHDSGSVQLTLAPRQTQIFAECRDAR